MQLLEFARRNLMECQKSIENITKLDKNFEPTFVDPHILSDINFNGHCLIKNDISIPKKVINLTNYTK